jgi:hypothetical protein
MRLEPAEIEKLANFQLPTGGKVVVGLRSSQDARSRQLEDFCRLLEESFPALAVNRAREDTAVAPWLKVGEGVYYQAVPLDRELAPFLEILQQVAARDGDPLEASLRRQLAGVEVPVEMRLYISPHCTFCPAAVRQLLPLAAWGQTVRLTIIDAGLFPELAREDNIRSVPTLVLGVHFRWSGKMQRDEIVEAVIRQDPCRMGVSVLRGMLEEGRAARAAEIMVGCGEVLPALVELLLHPKWPVRLGAMVTVEWVAEEDAGLAAQVVKRLWERFENADDQVRGDIVYLTGEFGDRTWAARLKAIQEGDFPPEVKEAAREAFSKLEGGVS